MKEIAILLVLAITFNQIQSKGGTTAQGGVQIGTGAAVTPPVIADFFVSPTGSDLNNGKFATQGSGTNGPFLTLNAARLALQGLPCTQAHITMARGGNYYGSATTFSGADANYTATCPVSYTNYPGETPVFSAGTRILGWSPSASGACTGLSNCYTASIPNTSAYFERLWYNNQPRMRPRMGATAGNLQGTYGISSGAQTSGGNVTGFTYSSGAVPSGTTCTTTLKCEITNFNKWTGPIQQVKTINTGTTTITFNCGGSCLGTGGGPGTPFQTSTRFVLENYKEGLKFPGQWYLDATTSPNWTLYYVANLGENPLVDTIEVGSSNTQLISTPSGNTANMAFTQFSGMTFEQDNFVLPSSGYNSLQLDPNLMQALINCNNCSNVTFIGNTIRETTATAIRILGTSPKVTISGNLIYDCGAYCVQFGIKTPTCATTCADGTVPNNGVISQNWIEGAGRYIASADGIMLGVSNNVQILNNDIGYPYDKGIEVCMANNGAGSNRCKTGNTWVHDIHIIGNDIHNISQGVLTDLACFYAMTSIDTAGNSGTGNTFLNNRCHDVNGGRVSNASELDPGAHGIYLDGATGGWDVENNLVYRVIGQLINMNFGPQNSGQSNTFKNNVLVNTANFPSPAGCIRVQTPSYCGPCSGVFSAPINACVSTPCSGGTPNKILDFTYQSNVCSQDVGSHNNANTQSGAPTTSTNLYQAFVKDVWSFAGTPQFSVLGNSNVSFSTWQGTYSQDTAGTASTSPGFNAPTACKPDNSVGTNWPYPTLGVCDDFSFTNGTGPGFGVDGTQFTNTYGPTVRITPPAVSATFPENTCQSTGNCSF